MTDPNGWRPQEEAKIDNVPVRVRTKAGVEFMALLGWYGADENGDDCVTWLEAEEGTAPPCWSDGACWLTNEHGVESDPVVSFLPAPPAQEEGK